MGSPERHTGPSHSHSLSQSARRESLKGELTNRNNTNSQIPASQGISKKQSRIHPVDGYSNSENMWEKIWNLEKQTEQQVPNKYPNYRSEFIVSCNNKQFKIKRNPLFKKIAKEMGIDLSNNR